ncbi:thioredoxin [Candidatus Falkowbacteria bacterium RIFOXYB2_FULL_47_14]|uniref:Thioredoxin n=1 Tax=Candidatus Falkowbacteria bacterium RIFOXYA2_FULL_47_19 TaxID=1797994 RepID=A0A1F5SH83_9BACT|nr:MAG: thioredoxin [Candidatus Falkowbacteria bacterium RIFOXYA2_FULL_47_19]OGF34523.1 MAG: thioredoxin [Candidatus Falkowbacteria bacterium RIFOXYC2_FULL_46_15]OGF43022.1 MAG: thioredoxin [Candidatus Falkowbacteria bacterium RIFOXYB2_FULL_47_14]
MSKQFTDANFLAEVIEASKTKPVLVDFFAAWCGPCKMQGPVIEEVSTAIGDKAIVGKVDTEAAPEVSSRYGIMSIPTLKIFKGGDEVETFVGLQSKEALLEALGRHA